MKLRADEISKVIELEIENYKKKLDVKEVGTVVQFGDGIARIYGLKNVMAGELLKFGSSYGMALNLESNNIGAIVLGGDKIREGDEVTSTGDLVKIGLSDNILGRVVDPLGHSIDGGEKIEVKEYYSIEKDAPKMFDRTKVNIPMETGIKAIDGMIPIGKGQRELIIGDRHTGKTSIAMDTIINQKGKDVICIYVAIGQKQSSIARMVEKLKEKGAMDYTTVVVSTASDSAALQYITPYSGCAIAEYFMDKGKDVLVVYDDLSKHATAYREISLLLRRPPGREAYPGDVFYLHSRLLERAAMMSKEAGGGSITALPIVETLAGDVSAYIPTNIISITDGQIYLESGLFNSDIRPAINAGLSVSRVGGDAQIKAMKQVASKLKIELAQYREVANFVQFGTDVDSATQKQLDKGIRIVELLKQKPLSPIGMGKQIILFYGMVNSFFDGAPLECIKDMEEALYRDVDSTDLEKEILSKRELDDSLRSKLDQFLNNFLKKYL